MASSLTRTRHYFSGELFVSTNLLLLLFAGNTVKNRLIHQFRQGCDEGVIVRSFRSRRVVRSTVMFTCKKLLEITSLFFFSSRCKEGIEEGNPILRLVISILDSSCLITTCIIWYRANIPQR